MTRRQARHLELLATFARKAQAAGRRESATQLWATYDLLSRHYGG